MLSRAAENIYWLARYLERAENTARLINATTQALLDMPRNASFGWDVLISVAGLDQLFRQSVARADEASIMRFLIADEKNPGSIVSSVRCARENCRTLREVLPRLAWERINALYLFVNRSSANFGGRSQRISMLDEVIERRQSVAGLLSDCMSHDVAYHFMDLGRHIERADMTTRIVDINAAVLVPRQQVPEDPAIALLWIGVLKALNAYQMYRRHVSVQIRGAGVVDYLLKDPHFPRTVRYGLDQVEGALSQLPRHANPLKAVRVAQRRLEGMHLEGVSSAVRHEYLDAIQSDLARIHNEISTEYFCLYQQPPALRQEQLAS
ncbi:MAG: alpha-E domain-containing protein [Betaproteobacteria bacterium]|nr:MAG: alpha-E domain-containing protein [Betaproteobacteria bacterium]